MKILVRGVALACALLVASIAGAAAEGIESRAVHFAKGASSASLKGAIKGDKIVDYKLRAKAGQTMTVGMKSDNTANYFNVLPPGSKDVAVYNSSVDGNDWRGTLAAAGEYTIRVYLMRSAARRNEKANYTLTVGINGSATAPAALGTAPAGDAKVKGTPYHATGDVPCSVGSAAPGASQCALGVIRGARGNAQVHVTSPGGAKRVLNFTGATVSAGEGVKVKAGRSSDNWLIDVDDEHYRIPDAVINGG